MSVSRTANRQSGPTSITEQSHRSSFISTTLQLLTQSGLKGFSYDQIFNELELHFFKVNIHICIFKSVQSHMPGGSS
jgi:hypothetical protein